MSITTTAAALSPSRPASPIRRARRQATSARGIQSECNDVQRFSPQLPTRLGHGETRRDHPACTDQDVNAAPRRLPADSRHRRSQVSSTCPLRVFPGFTTKTAELRARARRGHHNVCRGQTNVDQGGDLVGHPAMHGVGTSRPSAPRRRLRRDRPRGPPRAGAASLPTSANTGLASRSGARSASSMTIARVATSQVFDGTP